MTGRCLLSPQPADFNNYEFVYHLRPMRVNYLQPMSPLQQPSARSRAVGGEDVLGGARQAGEALLLESLGDSVKAEEEALAAATAASEAAEGITASAEEEAAARELLSDMDYADASTEMETPEAEKGLRAVERTLAYAAVELGDDVAKDEDWGEMDIGYRDRERGDREDERQSEEVSTAWEMEQQAEGMGDVKGGRWGEGEVGGFYGADEAAEMSALAVTLRHYPE